VSTIKSVAIEFDPAKSARNAAERGLPFEAVADFAFGSAMIDRDRRHRDEERWIALGILKGRVHVLIHMWRGGALRVISLRRANARETRRFERWRESR